MVGKYGSQAEKILPPKIVLCKLILNRVLFKTTFISEKSLEICFSIILLNSKGGKIFKISFTMNFGGCILQK